MHKVINRQPTIVVRLWREVARKMNVLSQAVLVTLDYSLDKSKRLVTQIGSRKTVDNCARLYICHALEVECHCAHAWWHRHTHAQQVDRQLSGNKYGE